MILPGSAEFEGVIGTTFDGEITVYPSADSELKWQTNPVWSSTFSYEAGSGSIGSNGKAYKSLIASIGIDPVGDNTGHWQILSPLNITGYKAYIKVGEISLENEKGITIEGEEGVVKFKAAKSMSYNQSPGSVSFALFMEDLENNYYEYISGKCKWKNP